jgi:hypothetical protein
VAEAGQYANLGTVVGHYGDVEVSDSDPSHYLGVIPPAPAIDIEKATNGEDADEPTGPEILVGDPVEWEYVVTNTGDVDLTDVTVTDDQLGAICGVSFLAVGDSFTCTVSGVAEAGQYANLGTVVGHYGDVEVSDSDPSHYFGVEPEPPCIGLTKTIDGPYRTADDLFLTDRIIPIAVQRDIDPPGTPNTENLFYFLVEITVENCGGADLTGVVVTDGFSNEAQPFETDDPSSVVIVPPPDPNNGMVHESLTWTVGTIPVGESRTLLVKVGTEFNPSGRLEPTSAPQTIYYNGQDEQTGSASVTVDGGLSASVGAMAISNGPEITCVGSMGEWDQLDAQSGPHIHPHDKCAGITTPLPITLSASYPMSDDGTQSPAQFRVFLPLLTAGMETPVGQAQTGYVFPSPWGIVQTVVQDWLR